MWPNRWFSFLVFLGFFFLEQSGASQDACSFSIRSIVDAGSMSSEPTIETLPFEGTFRNGMSFRSSAQAIGPKVLIAVPGGPGISGKYFDWSAGQMASALDADAVVLDLPNHGSQDVEKTEALNWARTLQFMSKALTELATDRREIILVGHSFGATVALELALNENVDTNQLVLVSLPQRLGWSSEFRDLVESDPSPLPEIIDEASFKKWWRQVLPFYFGEPVKKDLLDAISADTFYWRSLRMADGAPSLQKLTQKELQVPTVILEGGRDKVLGSGRLEALSQALPGATTIEMSESAHFPMLEEPRNFVDLIVDEIRED